MSCVSPPPEKKPARRGYSVRYKDKTLLSTIDPIAQAERAVAEASKGDRTLYFCPSPLLGYGLDTLLGSLSAGSAVLCVETDTQLLALSRSSINKAILNHSRFALADIGNGANEFGAELCSFVRKTWGTRVFRRVETIKLSGGWQLGSGVYEAMADLLRRDIAVEWGNAMTLVKLGRRFICNALRNLAMMERCRPITALSFGSKPMLVLGAGPSLDPLLDALEKVPGMYKPPPGGDVQQLPCTRRPQGGTNSDKPSQKVPGTFWDRPFVIICADTCLSTLRERGIVPDLAVILESQFWNMRDFTGLRDSGIPAAVDLSAYPPSSAVLNGPVFYFFTPWTPLRLFDRMQSAGLLPPPLPPLGSVGLTAVELARRLGSGPIITAGIDFSFTVDKTHARSSPAHLASLIAHKRTKSLFNTAAVYRSGTFTTVSKSNIPVRSDPAMRTYRGLFEQEFAADTRIHDIAGTGLPLGVQTLSVEEAVNLLAEEDLTQRHGGTKLQPENAAPSLEEFVKKEKSLLEELRGILTGSAPAEKLETLLDQADYLWAHFPDCAGAEGRRPPATDLAFLKRVRAEIDPFIKLWGLL